MLWDPVSQLGFRGHKPIFEVDTQERFKSLLLEMDAGGYLYSLEYSEKALKSTEEEAAGSSQPASEDEEPVWACGVDTFCLAVETEIESLVWEQILTMPVLFLIKIADFPKEEAICLTSEPSFAPHMDRRRISLLWNWSRNAKHFIVVNCCSYFLWLKLWLRLVYELECCSIRVLVPALA